MLDCTISTRSIKTVKNMIRLFRSSSISTRYTISAQRYWSQEVLTETMYILPKHICSAADPEPTLLKRSYCEYSILRDHSWPCAAYDTATESICPKAGSHSYIYSIDKQNNSSLLIKNTDDLILSKNRLQLRRGTVSEHNLPHRDEAHTKLSDSTVTNTFSTNDFNRN